MQRTVSTFFSSRLSLTSFCAEEDRAAETLFCHMVGLHQAQLTDVYRRVAALRVDSCPSSSQQQRTHHAPSMLHRSVIDPRKIPNVSSNSNDLSIVVFLFSQEQLQNI